MGRLSRLTLLAAGTAAKATAGTVASRSHSLTLRRAIKG